MLKNLPIIPSRTSQNFSLLLLISSHIIPYYSFIILTIFNFYFVSDNNGLRAIIILTSLYPIIEKSFLNLHYSVVLCTIVLVIM